MDEVTIINLALSQLGQLSINARTDNSKSAREANRIYDPTRDAELRMYLWNFAVVRKQLPALVTPPAFRYANAFQLPDDNLRIVQVGDFVFEGSPIWMSSGELAPYRIEGKTIVTDLPAPLNVRYIARITDPNMFDASFVSALACRLAMRLAETITSSDSKRKEAQNEYREAIANAIRANAIEMPSERLNDGVWNRARMPGW